jgi:poly(A) polymerase
MAERQHGHPALQDAIEDVFNARIGDVSGRGKLAGDMREIWLMQPRFEKRTGSAAFGLAEQPRFRAAFDFMRLRADAGEVEDVLADWWQEFSLASDELRQDMVDGVRQEQQQRKPAPRVQRAPAPAGAAPSKDASTKSAPSEPGSDVKATPAEDGEQAPRKRRRRRRTGAGRGEGGSDGQSSGQGPASE